MILVDASVWIDHFRTPSLELTRQLKARQVLLHSLIFGELRMGNLPRRHHTLNLLRSLRAAPASSDADVMSMVEREHLSGLGIGFIDAHLMASARDLGGASVWTRDRRLRSVLERFGVAYRETVP